MGPSGSGKTTLLNCLSGLDEIDEGRVLVDGKSIHELSDARRTLHRAESMGFVFQAFNLIPVFTATENVELPLLLARIPESEARRRARETLVRVGLGHRLDRRPPELSGGEQQRVAIARALAGRPRLVWADEPTGNLDSEMAASVMELLAELHAEGLTLILITHDPNVAAGADRLITVKDGELVADERLAPPPASPPGPAGRAVTGLTPDRRPRLAARSSTSSSEADPASARSPQRRPSAPRGRSRRRGIDARRGDHHWLGDRRRHDERVDPAVAYTHLGPVDEVVSVRGRGSSGSCSQPSPGPGRRDRRRPRTGDDRSCRDVDGTARARGAAHPGDRLDFERARAFGGDPAATGVSGPTPRSAMRRSRPISRAHSGSRRAAACRCTPTARRSRSWSTASCRGAVSQASGSARSRRRTTCSSAGDLRLLRATAGEVGPPTWMVAVSNRGGVEPGAARTEAATAQVRRVAAAVGIDAEVYPAKRRTLETADEVGEGFSSMFTAMGSFGVLAGLLLLVNLFVMLAAERKTELGMARAVGMRRSELVGAFATEGWLYALVATAFGVVVGIGLGAVLVAFSARIFASEHENFDLYLTVEPRSLANTFAIGFVVALATIVGTSLRVSRLNIIRAIRDLPEPPRRGRRWRGLVVGGVTAAAGVALTIGGASSREGFALLLGPTLVIAGLTPFAARLVKGRAVHSIAALALWSGVLSCSRSSRR